jgi:hypothetical protein
MLETFTPAVCGSRKRQIVAQALFAVAAVATAAALGLVLGFAGSLLGARDAVLVAAGLALLAAAREAGLVRFPLPQARRQVPDWWRFELPLPVWATGYGAGLGAGFFTYQPVSTFWVACAGALALGQPVPAALCLSLYGAGRATMVVWPRRPAGDPTAAVERLAGRRGALLRANAVALVACAVLLALAPTAGAQTLVASSALDPTVSGNVIAFATKGGDVVVRPPSGPDVVYAGASQPSLWGQYLAYVDDDGIQVVRWSDGAPVSEIAGAGVSSPSLEWPHLAYISVTSSYRRLIVRNLVNGTTRYPAKVSASVDLGRPSLRGGRVAWHVVTRNRSRIFVRTLAQKGRRVFAVTKIGRLSNPSLRGKRLIWVDARSGATYLRYGRLDKSKRKVLARIRSRNATYWTTSLAAGTAYMTRWTISSGAASVYRVPR